MDNAESSSVYNLQTPRTVARGATLRKAFQIRPHSLEEINKGSKKDLIDCKD